MNKPAPMLPRPRPTAQIAKIPSGLMWWFAIFAASMSIAAPSKAQEPAPALPWPDAVPVPELPAAFAEAVNRMVVVQESGMDRVEVYRDLDYSGHSDPNIRMDIYRSPASPQESRPAVVFIHGGTDARARPKDWGVFQSWGRLVASRGMVAVIMSRSSGYPEPRLLDGAADVESAIHFVRANAARYGVDPDRLCLFAFSAGGPLLAPFLRDAPPEMRCLVGYYPLMEIRDSPTYQGFESEDTLRTFSGVLQVEEAGRPVPMLIVRAGRDEVPGVRDSIDRFVSGAVRTNYPLTLANHPEAPHGFENQLDDAQSRLVIQQTLSFLAHHLALSPGSVP